MRNYSRKLKQYKLPRDRVQELRRLCIGMEDKTIVHESINDAIGTGDGLHEFMFRHVTRNDWPWSRLEANGVPCNGDTFRIYRHKFYYYLDKRLNGANNHAE